MSKTKKTVKKYIGSKDLVKITWSLIEVWAETDKETHPGLHKVTEDCIKEHLAWLSEDNVVVS